MRVNDQDRPSFYRVDITVEGLAGIRYATADLSGYGGLVERRGRLR